MNACMDCGTDGHTHRGGCRLDPVQEMEILRSDLNAARAKVAELQREIERRDDMLASIDASVRTAIMWGRDHGR